jgi:hypothetical protein
MTLRSRLSEVADARPCIISYSTIGRRTVCNDAESSRVNLYLVSREDLNRGGEIVGPLWVRRPPKARREVKI